MVPAQGGFTRQAPRAEAGGCPPGPTARLRRQTIPGAADPPRWRPGRGPWRSRLGAAPGCLLHPLHPPDAAGTALDAPAAEVGAEFGGRRGGAKSIQGGHFEGNTELFTSLNATPETAAHLIDPKGTKDRQWPRHWTRRRWRSRTSEQVEHWRGSWQW